MERRERQNVASVGAVRRGGSPGRGLLAHSTLFHALPASSTLLRLTVLSDSQDRSKMAPHDFVKPLVLFNSCSLHLVHGHIMT